MGVDHGSLSMSEEAADPRFFRSVQPVNPAVIRWNSGSFEV